MQQFLDATHAIPNGLSMSRPKRLLAISDHLPKVHCFS